MLQPRAAGNGHQAPSGGDETLWHVPCERLAGLTCVSCDQEHKTLPFPLVLFSFGLVSAARPGPDGGTGPDGRGFATWH